MFSSRKATRLFTLTAFAAIVGGGLFAYVTQASTNANPAPVVDRAGIASNVLAFRPWGEDLSPNAADAVGIELNLDGNASALFASDQRCGLPACGIR